MEENEQSAENEFDLVRFQKRGTLADYYEYDDDLESSASFRSKQSRIFESLRLVRSTHQLRGKDAAIEQAFDELDLNKTGVLERFELVEFMQHAADRIKVVDPSIVESAVDALMEDVLLPEATKTIMSKETQLTLTTSPTASTALTPPPPLALTQGPPPNALIATSNSNALVATGKQHSLNSKFGARSVISADSVITKKQFKDMFRKNEDLLRVFEDADNDDQQSLKTVALSKEQKKNQRLRRVQNKKKHQENSQIWEHAWTTKWKNAGAAYVWFFLYIFANITAFVYKAHKYAIYDEAREVFGNCVVIARGAAQCLNLNACLILLPVCRHLLTRMRAAGHLRFWFPFDACLEFHMLVGLAILFFTLAHVLAHICDFHRFAKADRDDLVSLFGDKLGNPNQIPDSYGGRWLLLLTQPAAITGVIMLGCMMIAYPLILTRRTHFNRFWLAHHLLLVMLVELCLHGTGNLLEHCQSIYWVTPPLLFYFIPRLIRECGGVTVCPVVDIAVKKGDVIGLRMQKPQSWEHRVKAGMYVFINIPAVSNVEWHPFTLTSAPHENFIEVHFRNVGDWTQKAHTYIKDQIVKDEKKKQRRQEKLVVKVEGPIGASSQGFSDYPIVVLVGAGIGVTPMISVLKQLLVEPGHMKRAYLYWTVRERNSFEWFSELIDAIYQQDMHGVLHIRHFLTSVKMEDDDRDLGTILFQHAYRAKHKRTNFDLFLQRQNRHQVDVGRPNWSEEFASVKKEAKSLGHDKCGVFLCGPGKLAEAVEEVTFELSNQDRDFHFYFTKETF